LIIINIIIVLYLAAVLFSYTFIYITICRVNRALTIVNPLSFILLHSQYFLPHVAFLTVYLACQDWNWLYNKLTEAS